MADPKVLCVDDERSILDAFRRQLRGKFQLEISSDPAEALEMVSKNGPYAVIVSDMRMPGIDGIEFLKQAEQRSPDSIRVMLTGNADRGTAIRAVNEGNVFRFLSKPCSTEELEKVVLAGVARFQTENAERELLQRTLGGCVKVLTDMLSAADPLLFGEAIMLRDCVREESKVLGIRNSWEIELGAMLAKIGRIVVPTAVLSKLANNLALSPSEEALVSKIPEAGRNLLINVPRLEKVAEIVYYQNKNYDGTGFPSDEKKGEEIPVGARIIHILSELQNEMKQGVTREEALQRLGSRPGKFDPVLIGKLLLKGDKEVVPVAKLERYSITAKDLCVGQRLLEKVEAQDGRLLISAGAVVTELLLKRLQNYALLVGVREPLYVDARIPSGH